MIKKKIKVVNRLGVHGRFCAYFLETILPFKDTCKITVFNERGNYCDAFSVIDLLSLALPKGSEVDVVVEGENESELIKLIEHFFENGS